MAQRQRRDDDDLTFEIDFYERLVARHPTFVEPLLQLGEAYTRANRWTDGLQVDRRLTKLRPHDPITWYNLACSYALLEQLPYALRALKKAILLGYNDWDFLQRDPHLAALRRAPEFQHFLAKARASR